MYPQGYIRSDIFCYTDDAVGYVSEDTSFLTTTVVSEESYAIPRDRDVWTGLGSYLFLVVVLAIFSYFLGVRRNQLLVYLKTFAQQNGGAHSSDVFDRSTQRFQNIFFLIACFLLMAFGVLFLQQSDVPSLVNINLSLCVLAAVIVVVYLLAKWFLMKIYGWSLMNKSDNQNIWNGFMYSFNFIALGLAIVMVLNEWIGMTLFTIEVITLVIVVLVKLFSMAKIAYIFSNQRFSAFHFILYFCALEILPICILCKSMFLIRESI